MNITEKNYEKGFTLIEVVISIIIIGILAAVTVNTIKPMADNIKIENTKVELEEIGDAIAGNQEIQSNGVRSQFGYLGDVGSFPPNLDALRSNPGGYSTWNGPYLKSDINQNTNDYKTDAWGTTYTYSAGVEIKSTGSGSEIVYKFGNSNNDFLLNSVSGIILDKSEFPPGLIYKDSLFVNLVYPNGSGGLVSKSSAVQANGYYFFDSIPIGSHALELIYTPTNDTINRFVSVTPSSNLNLDIKLSSNLTGVVSSGGLTFVTNTDSVFNSPQCHNISFYIENNTGSAVSVSSLSASWSSPTAYFREIDWNATKVVLNPSPSLASGDVSVFSSTQVIADGSQVQIFFKGFKSNTSGGSNVDMSNVNFTITLSDGSIFAFNSGSCI